MNYNGCTAEVELRVGSQTERTGYYWSIIGPDGKTLVSSQRFCHHPEAKVAAMCFIQRHPELRYVDSTLEGVLA